MAFTQNKQQTFSQPVQPTAPDFNDVLDVLNPNFTPVEKLHGMISLPFQPALHPLKTIKGVFETYSKIATVPLAVYSGNLDRVKGIIQGTDDFSGKDVIAQMEGTTKDQVHGILPSLAGFGLDIASDPFIGVARLPEEIASTMNHLTIQAAAPGLPQALNWMGAKEWTARWFGSGVGFGENKDISFIPKESPIHTMADTSTANVIKPLKQASIDASVQVKQDAINQIKALTPSPEDVKPIIAQAGEGQFHYINDPYKYHAGFELGLSPQERAIYQASGQSATDLAELKRIATTESDLQHYNHTLERQTEVMTPEDSLLRGAKDFEFAQRVQDTKLKNIEAGIEESDQDIISRLMKEDISKSEVGFNLQNTLNAFSDANVPVEGALRYLKDRVSQGERRVIKYHTPFELRWNKKNGYFIMKDSDRVVYTDLGPVPHSQWAKNPSKYNAVFSDVQTIFGEHLTSKFDAEGVGAKEIYNELFNAKAKFAEPQVANTAMDIKELKRKLKDWESGKVLPEPDENPESFMKRRSSEISRLKSEITQSESELTRLTEVEQTTADKELPKAYEHLANWLSDEPIVGDYPKVLDSLPRNPSFRQFDDWAQQHMPNWWAEKRKDLYAKLDTAVSAKVKESTLDKYAKESAALPGGVAKLNEAKMNMNELAYDIDESQTDAITEELWMSRDNFGFKNLLMVDVSDLPNISKSSASFQDSNTILDTLKARNFIKWDAVKKSYIANTDVMIPTGFNAEFKMRTLFPQDLVSDFAGKVIDTGLLERLEDAHPELTDSLVKLMDTYRTAGKDAAIEFQNTFKEINNYISDELSGTNLVGDTSAAEDINLDAGTSRDVQAYWSNPIRQLDEFIQPLKENYTRTESLDLLNRVELMSPSYAYDTSKLGEEVSQGLKTMFNWEKLKSGSEIKYFKDSGDYTPKPRAPYVYTPSADAINQELARFESAKVVEPILDQLEPMRQIEMEEVQGTALVPAVQDAIEQSVDREYIAAAKNLSAEQLNMFMSFRQGIADHNILKDMDKVYSEIQDFAIYSAGGDEEQAKKIIKKINEAAVRELHKSQIEIIRGDNIAVDLLNRNNTIIMNNKVHANQLAQFDQLATKLNEEIGIEGLFKTKQLNRPNAHFSKFELDYKVLKDNPAHVKQYKEWLSKNKSGTTGFNDISFDLSVKSKMSTLSKDEAFHANNLIKIMTEANQKMNDFYKFAGLDEQVTSEVDKFYPHSAISYSGQNAQDAITNGKGMVTDQNVTLSDMMKRELGLTGTLSSSAYGRSVMGNPFATFINVMDKEGKLKPVPLFSRNPQVAYRNMFSSAFADHTNLRMAKELILNNRYKIANMEFPHSIPKEAIASHDVIVPQYANGKLVGLKSYAPTDANMTKFANHGYLIDRTVSAEIRAMLKYESYVSKSPVYGWFMKNIITPFKSGVLMNLGFPISNGGDMYFKTLMSYKFSELPEYHKNIMAAPAIIKAHSDHLRAFATLTNSEIPEIKNAMRDVPYIEYLRDMIKWTEGKGKAKWMEATEQHLAERTDLINKGVPVQDDLWKAIQYEIYISLPVATTNQKEIVNMMSDMQRKYKDVEFKNYIEDVLGSKVGGVLRRISMDNTVAKRVSEFNENLENSMRFAHFAMATGLSKDTAREVLKDKDLIWHANAMIKDTHMHFAEYPANAVWMSSVFPFWQFPVKNAIWWTRFIGKHPELASQVYRFKKDMWGGDDDSFWSQMGALPATDSLVFRGMPGVGSLSTFAMGLDKPTNLIGNRMNPIIRPFFTTNGQKYHSYNPADRNPKTDNLLAAWLHGMNPVEGNIQWGLNLIGSQDPMMARLMPSVFRAQSQQDLAQQQTNSKSAQTSKPTYNKN